MTISTKWDLNLNIDDILRGQGADPQVVHSAKPRLLSMAESVFSNDLGLLHPIAIFTEFRVLEHRHEQIHLEKAKKLTGPLVTRHLAGAQSVVAVVCSIGSDLEDEAAGLFPENPLYAMALDGLGNAGVESLAQQVCGQIAEKVLAEGKQASTPLSPGNPDWPVEIGQPQVFALLQQADIGISLTSGGMMIPKKSISFVVGIGQQMSQDNLCEVCSLSTTCRYQHA